MSSRSSRIRVMQIVDRLDEGGAERIVVDILKNLDREVFDPVVVTTREPGRFAPEVERAGIRLLSLERRSRYDLPGFVRLVRIIRSVRPHIVHTHKVGSNTLGRLAALFAHVPVVIAHEHTLPCRGLLQRHADRILASLTTRVVTCDRALRSALIDREGLPEQKIFAIHNGVDLQRIPCPQTTKGPPFELLNSETLEPSHPFPIVGTFARLVPQKDIPNLLAAVPFVLRRIPDARFIIAGDGPLRTQLEVETKARRLADRVRFLGFRSDTPALFEAIDLFVLSSSWEGLPVTVLEAMGYGKPVVSTDVGGVAEAVLNEATGLLVPARNPAALGKAIVSLLADPRARYRMGQLGRLRVIEQFSIQAMIRKVEALYTRELTASRSTARRPLNSRTLELLNSETPELSRPPMKERLLLIGPLPPPEHGTSLPFRALIKYLRRHSSAEVVVIDSESGDKKQTRLFSPQVLRPFLAMTRQLLQQGSSCSRFLIYGSQRFVATAGVLYTLLIRLLWSREVSIYIQGGAFDQYHDSLAPVARRLLGIGLRQAKTIMVQSNLVCTALSSRLHNVRVVPNWVDDDFTRGFGRPALCTLHFALCTASHFFPTRPSTFTSASTSSPWVRFAFVGDIVRSKGILELVRAFSSARRYLLRHGIPVTLDIYGPCKDSSLDAIRSSPDLDCAGIAYHGPQRHSRLPGLLARHDALVLPTWWPSEGYPGIIVEAMLLGLPVIATRFRAIPELVHDHENGLLCEPHDPLSLSHCLCQIAEDAALRIRLGKSAQMTAQRFTISVVGPELCRACGIRLDKRTFAPDPAPAFPDCRNPESPISSLQSPVSNLQSPVCSSLAPQPACASQGVA